MFTGHEYECDEWHPSLLASWGGDLCFVLHRVVSCDVMLFIGPGGVHSTHSVLSSMCKYMNDIKSFLCPLAC